LISVQARSGQASRPPAGAGDPAVMLGRNAVDLWLRTHFSSADQVQGIIWRGRVRAAAAEHDAAIADFRMALERDPEHFDGRFQLAITVGSADPAGAASLLEQLRELEPENDAVLTALAQSYRLLGRIQDARDILSVLDRRGLNQPWLSNELGLTELDAGRPAEAEHYLRQTLAKNPDDLVANLALSRCMFLTGKEKEAALFQQRYEQSLAKVKSSRAQAKKP
jgi:predicted Zn-dependent protease